MTIEQFSVGGPDQPSNPDDIVIAGMSGTFPGALNIDEFEHKLYNKIDMVSKETRFEFVYLDQPERAAIIPVNDKFDTGFFGIHERQAEFMDSAIQIFLEKCTEAILDAGLHPEDLENTRTGVYVGTCVSESEIFMSRKPKPEKSFFWTGNARCMIANRASYFFKLKGPSLITDTACSSSLYALEHAYNAMRHGEIDMAIVGGSNLCAFAGTTIQFARLGVLSHDGICKVFDEKADGYVRAEGICALLLQKQKDAKRIYCQVIHAKTNCDGYKEEGITYPSGEAQLVLLKEFYQECGVPTNSLSYLEAHGTGTKVGDPEECESVDQIFTKNRDKPLLIGSVKSCVGHSEPVSGCISVVKCILALESGKIAPNLHYHTPKADIKSILEGRLKVVTDVTNFEDDRGLIGINSFGFGGGNCHVLIRGNPKEKINNGIPNDNLARLVCVSGRTEESIKVLLDYIAEVGLDGEFIGLIHNVFRKNIANHLYRGYIILSKKQVLETSINDGNYAHWKIPPVFVVFGEIEDWYSVLRNLREIDVVSDTIKRIGKALSSTKLESTVLSGKLELRKPYNVLGNIITQLCIADLLKVLKLTPKATAGYSYGELICAYFDGVLKMEEVLQCAYILNTELCRKHDEIEEPLTNGVTNNGPGYVNTALRHSLINKLLKVLKSPKTWNGRSTSAEYFTDAALKYRSNESQSYIKSNSIILKIGANNLNTNQDDLENIVQLTMEASFENLLKILGSLYQFGYNPAIQNLYPAVQFPVSRTTPRISSKIKWNHLRTYVCRQPPRAHIYMKQFVIDLRKPDWTYISGHMIDGRILFPAAGYLYLVWDVFAEEYKVLDALAVTFENVRFIRATSILPSDPVTLVVVISDSGYFEITDRDSIIVTGTIKEVPDESKAYRKLPEPVGDDHQMDTKDVYKELRLRGYNYHGQFQSIKTCDITGCRAKIQWNENYVTFMDNLFQLKIINKDTRLLYVPTHLSKLTILPLFHRKFVKRYEAEGESIDLPSFNTPECDTIKSGGIEVQGMLASPIPRRKYLATPVLERYEFVPNETELPLALSVRLNTQLMCENLTQTRNIASLEVIDSSTNVDTDTILITPLLKEALGDLPLVQSDAKIFSSVALEIADVNVVTNGNLRAEANVYTVIIGTKLLQKNQVLEDCLYALNDNGFIMSRESPNFTPQDIHNSKVVLLTSFKNEKETLIMLGRTQKLSPVYEKITEDPEFSWLAKIQSVVKHQSDVVLYSEHEPLNGIIGFINCLRREPETKSIRAVLIMDENKSFDANEPTFAEQLKKNLAVNIYKNGTWGTYRHLPIDGAKNVKAQHVFVNQITTGDLSSLRWMQGEIQCAQAQEIPVELKLVEVYYSALNFKDIMIASGKISNDAVNGYERTQLCDLGMEYSGIDQDGNRIMGMVSNGGLSTKILAQSHLSWNIPDDWSLEDAVTVPVVYGTMIYALRLRGSMQRGESILIHSGVGGVGQAAIRYCLFHGLTVFTTVGSDQRKEYIRKMFPQIPESHIGNSHDTSFEQMILRETNGRGVDMVLNSLAEEKLLTSVRCLARGGRMMEIGKYDLKSNNKLNLLLFQKEGSFHGVMLDMFFTLSPTESLGLSKIMNEGIKEGSIKPLNRHIFKFDEVEQAFRFLAGGKHTGKVIIEVRPEEETVDLPKLHSQEFSATPRYCCNPKKTHIIIGGLGGFGLELADWLILRGARQLVLASRRGFTSGYQRQRVSIWETYGAIVHVSTIDLSTKSGCAQLIKEAQEIGPVEALYNLAVNLQDGVFENLTVDNYKASLTPKAYTTKYLDEVTRKNCPDLRNFVVFSSVSCGRGNAGQTNYGMANSIMERICEARVKDGYPAKAIEWGAVGEVGILSELQFNNATEIQIGGTLLQKISSCLQVLDPLLSEPSPIVSSIVVAEKTRGATSSENVVEAVASILGVTDLKTVSLHSTLAEIGMDSMTSVEIKQMLEREFDIFLSPKEIRTLTLSRLQEIQNAKESGQAVEEDISMKLTNIQVAKMILFEQIVDEYESDIPSLQMMSKVEDTVEAPTVIVIPGLEGFAKIMEPICLDLEAHVHVLQLNYRDTPETIFDMVDTKMPLAEKHISKSKPFQIIAYSYGVAEALEMVNILEAKGYTGTLYCIDGAPKALTEYAENVLGKTQDEAETRVILGILMFYDISMTQLMEFSEEFSKCGSLEAKIDKTVEVYGKVVPLSVDYFRRLIEGAVKRIMAIKNYKPSYEHIKSELILFKPTEPTFKTTADDFGLSDICNKSISVYTIEGNHSSILKNQEIVKIINSRLIE